ncbi:DnaJ domain-containing protein, partial [Leptodontidium sp. 2 PMI_412]
MNSTLPPDPYKLLGVTKEAKLPEIRSAHRKLVLKCHPDKVQDAALKAIKQDEFQKVQQAYELLSDESKRSQYDEQVKLFELRKEMGRGNPTPRSNPFEYEVKTAEPRPTSYGRQKVYSYPTSVPRSNEELYEERHMPRKSASNESASERKRAAMKEEEMRFREAAARKLDEERERQRQKERERESTKRAHREKKKSSDKDRRRGTEDK